MSGGQKSVGRAKKIVSVGAQTVYFQVPDARTKGPKIETLKVLGGASSLTRLRRYLGLESTATAEQVYAHVCNFQRLNGLTPDGAVGPLTWQILHDKQPLKVAVGGVGGAIRLKAAGTATTASAAVLWRDVLTVEWLTKLFPFTKILNLQNHAPYVLAALDAAGYTPQSEHGPLFCQLALATIRAETEGFEPISELRSHFNTALNGPAFGLYDPPSAIAKKLGNTQIGDGLAYKGRGFVQLTGRSNYTRVGQQLGLKLHERPFMANLPEIAAVILVQFLSNHRMPLVTAMTAPKPNLKAARKIVNGGSHGFERFQACCDQWAKVWPELVKKITLLGQGVSSHGASKAPIHAVTSMDTQLFLNRNKRLSLPVKHDRVDVRDTPYHPPLGSLPSQYPSENTMRQFWPLYRSIVLDQGREGACTGFGLACTINYLRFIQALSEHARDNGSHGLEKTEFDMDVFERVSPRMLYEFARRYDEFEGDDYEGSSCRGALKAWHKHGVCGEQDWPYAQLSPATPDWASKALDHTLGVYYRVDKTSLVDMQAAIVEVGAVFVSAAVHEGWLLKGNGQQTARAPQAQPTHANIPVIACDVRTVKPNGAHAFALVGYNRDGFIVQNSWGLGWGQGGFAVLSYADWLAHAMDAWVATLGVPGVVNNASSAVKPRNLRALSTHSTGHPPSSKALNWLLAAAVPPPEDDAIKHSLVLDNGMVKSVPTVDILGGLSTFATLWPKQWFDEHEKQLGNGPRRIVLYAHGGLNDEADGVLRAGKMAKYFLDNGIYPIFLVWKTGILESLKNVLDNKVFGQSERAGNTFSDQISDPFIENTIGATLACWVWNGIKNAATHANTGNGGLIQLANALQGLLMQEPRLQVHLMGHSAGSILLGGMLDALATRRVPIASAQLLAPACTIAFANRYWLPYVGNFDAKAGTFPLSVHALHDTQEQADTELGVYRKSLLYLVARGIEENRPTPLLGMHGSWDRAQVFKDWNGDGATQQQLALFDRLRERLGSSLKLTLIDTPSMYTATDLKGAPIAQSAKKTSHGKMDNNAPVLLDLIRNVLTAEVPHKAIDLSHSG